VDQIDDIIKKQNHMLIDYLAIHCPNPNIYDDYSMLEYCNMEAVTQINVKFLNFFSRNTESANFAGFKNVCICGF